MSLGSGQSFEVKADGDARLAGIADLSHAGLLLASGRGSGGFLFYDFGPGSTPVISSAIRVRRDLWDRLLPWRRARGVLTGPDGRTYRQLPEDLSGHELEARRYDLGKSSMSPGELSAMAVADLFEDVVALQDEREAEEAARESAGRRLARFPLPTLSFRLPTPPRLAPLAAADPVEGAPPVAEADSPDGLTRFALFDRGDGEYWLEVSRDASTEVPVVARLRYTTTDKQRRELLVPVGGGTQSSSVVALHEYDGGPWHAWIPVPLASMWAGPPELVEISVQAAVTVATVRAWERLASAIEEHDRKLIMQAVGGTR